jgi:hypothetical protein
MTTSFDEAGANPAERGTLPERVQLYSARNQNPCFIFTSARSPEIADQPHVALVDFACDEGFHVSFRPQIDNLKLSSAWRID